MEYSMTSNIRCLSSDICANCPDLKVSNYTTMLTGFEDGYQYIHEIVCEHHERCRRIYNHILKEVSGSEQGQEKV